MMATLEELLNTVELPDMHVLFARDNPDYDSLERAARAVFRRDDVTVTDAARCPGYTGLGRVEVTVGDEQKAMYVKREANNALSAAVQMEMNNLLREDFIHYAVSLVEDGTKYTILEEAQGIDLNYLKREERESIFASEGFAYAYGHWLEGVLLIGLCDRAWRNVKWDGTSLNDLDYGWTFGLLLRHPPHGNYDSGGALYRLGHIRFDLLNEDEIERGRQDLRKIIAENLSKNAEAIQALCVAYEKHDTAKKMSNGPRKILLHYATNLKDHPLRKLFKDILAR